MQKTEILIVDDDEGFRQLFAESLTKFNFNIRQASNGEEALKVLQSNESIRLILSDVKMPKMNGIDLLKQLKSKKNSPHLIFVSGFCDLSSEEAYDLGAVSVFTKPFRRKELVEKIQLVLSRGPENWITRPPRYEVQMEISLSVDSYHAKILNIGRGGAFLGSNGDLPKVDSQVGFNINIQGQTPMQLSGIGLVKWIRDQPDLQRGFGIEFIFLDEPGRTHLQKLLKQVDPIQYIPKA